MDALSFNFRHLAAFVKIVDEGSLLAASRAVHMSQPALTQAVNGLESQLAERLFDRQSDGMAPTAAAQIVYPRFKAALAHLPANRVTSTQARAFVALAQGGSYTEASTATGLAKASLHRAVRDLEARLNQTLVSRRGRGLELTHYGAAFARRLKLARAELSSAISEIEALREAGSGRIAIGAMPLCRARLLPAAIVDFQETTPRSQIIVAEGSHMELVEPLRDGDLDFLIGALRDPGPGPDLVQEPLFEDHPVVLARAGHAISLGKKSKVSLEQLAAYDWCLPQEGVPLRDRWNAMFEEAGIAPPRVRVECGSVIAIRQILMKTDCLTILSRDQVAVELEAGWLTVIREAPGNLTRTIGLTYRENWTPNPMQRRFLETLRAHV